MKKTRVPVLPESTEGISGKFATIFKVQSDPTGAQEELFGVVSGNRRDGPFHDNHPTHKVTYHSSFLDAVKDYEARVKATLSN